MYGATKHAIGLAAALLLVAVASCQRTHTRAAADAGASAGGDRTGAHDAAGRGSSGSPAQDCGQDGTSDECAETVICGSRPCPLLDAAKDIPPNVHLRVGACCVGPDGCGIALDGTCIEIVTGVSNGFCDELYGPIMAPEFGGCCRRDGLCGVGFRDSHYGLVCQIPNGLGTEGLGPFDCDPNDMNAGTP
jgi:hypothetical protein